MKILKYGLLTLGLGVLALTACSGEKTPASTGGANQPPTAGQEEKIGLSSETYAFEKEYFFEDYNKKSLEDETRQGIKTFENKDDIVFDAITYEELVDIFESEGNYLILFGGSWCHNTRAAVPFINQYAKEYNIDTIYNFDFYLDGTNSNTHIRNTNQSDPTRVTPGVEYNYLYGELVSKYLTNLTDFVEYKTGSSSSLTYTNNESSAVNVAKVQVPFLFLYNKDNTVNHAEGAGTPNEDGTYPIVYGFEEMIDLDDKGVYSYRRNVAKEDRTYYTDQYKTRLKVIFDFIKDNNVKLTTYSDGNYFRNIYNEKSNSEIFKENDKVNIKPITYRQLIWLLEHEGDSVILFGGSWCPNTQATIKLTNDYAVKNNVVVYNFDTKLDSGLAKKYWNYSKDLHIRDTSNSFVRLYTDLIEKYLTNIVTLYDVNASESYKSISYTDASGNVVKVKKLQVPYLLSYNKDNKDSDGEIAPITAYFEKMLTLNSAQEDYVYKTDNYKAAKEGTFNVISTFLKSINKEAKEI